MDAKGVKEEVLDAVLRMNRLWTVDHDLDALADYFHPDMIAITPVDRLRRAGREACIQGWKDFSAAATIRSWKETDPLVLLFGHDQFAVVSYYFEIVYEMDGEEIHSSGRDLFSLVNENDRWWIVSNQFSPYP